MPNLLFLSQNSNFAEDLTAQLNLYLPDFTVFREDDRQTFFDLVLLDEMPDKVTDYLSRPIPIFLLAKHDEEYTDIGAEVIMKPLVLSSLLDSLKSGIHMFENSEEGYLRFNQYELRPLAKKILNERNGDVTKLTEKEVSIIKYLYKAGSKIISKNELLQEVWGYSPDVTTHTIETHIYRLRQKVEQENTDAQLILTSDGGYQLKF